MKFSFEWLQSYIGESLPHPEKLAEVITQKLAEVESVTELSNGDFCFDVKVLPDRACYLLSHRGLAYEIAAITGLPYRDKTLEYGTFNESLPAPDILVDQLSELARYSLVRIDGLSSDTTPPWMKQRLLAVGQKSIHPIVDAINYILFDIGQPLHAFDADLVSGVVHVRYAKPGESFTTLDGKEIPLTVTNVVIADDSGILALAGIKGGNRAGVSSTTTRILLESASFNASYVRRASGSVGIQTDASKRFENNVTSALVMVGMKLAIQLLRDIAGTSQTEVSKASSVVTNQENRLPVELSLSKLQSALGVSIDSSQIERYLTQLRFAYEKTVDGYSITPPVFRNDIVIPEDVIEEIARLYGFDEIPIEDLDLSTVKNNSSTLFELISSMKSFFIERGYLEHYGRVLIGTGDIAVLKSYAEDKKYLRNSLSPGIVAVLEQNIQHTLFDTDSVAMFEIGTVFKRDSEEIRCIIAVGQKTHKKNSTQKDIETILDVLIEEYGISVTRSVLLDHLKSTIVSTQTITYVEFSLADLEAHVSKIPSSDILTTSHTITEYYTPFSVYPRIIRDVALFTPPDVDPAVVAEQIRKSAGEYCTEGPALFDVYQKRNAHGDIEQQSLAFRMAFQSTSRTLTDEEVEVFMASVYQNLTANGYTIR